MRRVWNRLFDLTGFRGKTLWDLLGLLIVPLFIAGATLVFSISELRREERRAQDTVLQSYIQDMTELLLHEGLFKPKPLVPFGVPFGEQPTHSSDVSPVKQIARASTLATVRQLDGARKGLLLQFLYESSLIGAFFEEEPGYRGTALTKVDPIINLRDADLRNANLNSANLYYASLNHANLENADLRNAVLRSADLFGANLNDADLNDAILESVELLDADLRSTNLSGADLDLANLTSANLRRANLSGADLRHADLSSAKECTNEQLAQAKSLVGATLPDGTKMTEEAWEEFKRRYR